LPIKGPFAPLPFAHPEGDHPEGDNSEGDNSEGDNPDEDNPGGDNPDHKSPENSSLEGWVWLAVRRCHPPYGGWSTCVGGTAPSSQIVVSLLRTKLTSLQKELNIARGFKVFYVHNYLTFLPNI
jgi:hypothetical protein